METPEDEAENKICGNCKHFITNNHCSLTGVPSELHQTCELHKFKFKPKNKAVVKKVITGGILFTVVSVLFKIWLISISHEEPKKDNDLFKFAKKHPQKPDMLFEFQTYTPGTDTLGMKRFIGIFYTDDFDYSKQLFRKQLPNYFNSIPFSGTGDEKIFIENKLFVGFTDSIRFLVTKISGQIKLTGTHKYFYESVKQKRKNYPTIKAPSIHTDPHSHQKAD